MEYDASDEYDTDRGDQQARFLQARSDLFDTLSRLDATARLLALEYLEIPERRQELFVASLLSPLGSAQLAALVKDVLSHAGHSDLGTNFKARMWKFAEFRNLLAHSEIREKALHRGEFEFVSARSIGEVTVAEMEQSVESGRQLADEILSALNGIRAGTRWRGGRDPSIVL